MNPLAKPLAEIHAPIPAGTEASWASLRDAVAAHPGKALVFHYGGRDTLAGYHVTEVKTAQFAALDCGANPEAWIETMIQLWDVPEEPARARLSVDTFLAIMRKVAAQVPLHDEARLTFEVSDGVRPIELYRIENVVADGGVLRIALAPRAASCKPRDRWLAHEAPSAQPFRGVAEVGAACCG